MCEPTNAREPPIWTERDPCRSAMEPVQNALFGAHGGRIALSPARWASGISARSVPHRVSAGQGLTDWHRWRWRSGGRRQIGCGLVVAVFRLAAVGPVFGTLAGFDGLLAGALARGGGWLGVVPRGQLRWAPVVRRGPAGPGQPAVGLVRVGRPSARGSAPGHRVRAWARGAAGAGSGRLGRCRSRAICGQAGAGSPEVTGGGRR